MTDTPMSLLDAAAAALPFMVSGATACHGDKCREPNCESCFAEDSVDAYVERACEAASNLTAAIANAATMAPPAAAPREASAASAWVVERTIDGVLHYAGVSHGALTWIPHNAMALRLTRRVDAVALMSTLTEAGRVAEHVWLPSESASRNWDSLALPTPPSGGAAACARCNGTGFTGNHACGDCMMRPATVPCPSGGAALSGGEMNTVLTAECELRNYAKQFTPPDALMMETVAKLGAIRKKHTPDDPTIALIRTALASGAVSAGVTSTEAKS